ncbi:MAG: hypothetical protein WA874_00465 [Chryseosolibacter sp.]
MRIEVFKTNVKDAGHAQMLLERIHFSFSDYTATFDLEDCDRILRVASATGLIDVSSLMKLLRSFGVQADVLPDDIPQVFHF